jgi:hypothetical protein
MEHFTGKNGRTKTSAGAGKAGKSLSNLAKLFGLGGSSSKQR